MFYVSGSSKISHAFETPIPVEKNIEEALYLHITGSCFNYRARKPPKTFEIFKKFQEIQNGNLYSLAS